MAGHAVFTPGNVAVITGAALGIGRAMARRLAADGMRVVLADLAGPDLEATAEDVRTRHAREPSSVLAVPTDVSREQDIANLHEAARAAFGRVDFLANNAASRGGRGMDADIADWRHAMDVNLWGPVYAARAFLPGMLASEGPGVIVNTGSKQGITNPPGHPVYNMTKSALKTYTEALEHELRSQEGNDGARRVSAHLLVPGWTTTGRAEHKPGAWRPEQVVDFMLEALGRGDFYIICPDDEVSSDMDRRRILWGAQDITENRPPLSRWHPDFAELARQACS